MAKYRVWTAQLIDANLDSDAKALKERNRDRQGPILEPDFNPVPTAVQIGDAPLGAVPNSTMYGGLVPKRLTLRPTWREVIPRKSCHVEPRTYQRRPRIGLPTVARGPATKPRKGDVSYCHCAQVGTTWMQRIVNLLIFQSPQPRALGELSPWLDSRIRLPNRYCTANDRGADFIGRFFRSLICRLTRCQYMTR